MENIQVKNLNEDEKRELRMRRFSQEALENSDINKVEITR